jgi:uncharacterized protein (TIGR03067 family)
LPDIETLQGTWNIVSLEMDGRSMPSGEAAIRIQGSRFTTTAMGGEYSGALEIDESASPKAFNLRFESGPEQGNTSHGIYQLEGDTWKICLTLRGGTRPGEFATKPGSGLALEFLKRAAKSNARAKAAPTLSGEPAPELAGDWSMVSAVMSGRPLEPEYVKIGKRIATPGELQVRIGPQTVLKANYAVDRSTTPPQMNYLLPGGRLQFGIWELDGTQLKTCFGAPGQPRPAEFSSTPGDGRTFTIWSRSAK